LKGRRVPIQFVDGAPTFPILEQPGDYAGPLIGWTGVKPAVFFLKPNARDQNAPLRARSVQHVVSPPHVFTEEDDGSLTIAASIGDTAGRESVSDGWHGFLERGVWRKV
jgi:hypothetical protein